MIKKNEIVFGLNADTKNFVEGIKCCQAAFPNPLNEVKDKVICEVEIHFDPPYTLEELEELNKSLEGKSDG